MFNNTIGGNFSFLSAGTVASETALSNSNAGTGANTITINGDLIISANTASIFGAHRSGSAGAVTSLTVAVKGNFNQSGGNFKLQLNTGITLTTWNLDGNFTLSAGTFQGNNAGYSEFHFTNVVPTHTYTKTGGTLSSTTLIVIDANAKVDAGTSTFDGTIPLTINAGATLTSANASGSITTSGTKTLSSTANYVFNGASAQTLSSSITGANNFTVNNSTGVTLGANTTITGTLTLTSGTLTVGAAKTLTISGDIITTSGTIDGSNSTSSVVFNSSSAQNIPSGSFTGNIQALTINNSAGVTFNANRTVAGTLTLTAGTLTFSSSALTLSTGATIVRNAGNLAAAPTFAGTVNVTYTNSSPITSSYELPSSSVTALSTAGGSALVTLNSNTAVTSTFTVGGGNFTIPSGVSLTISAATSTVSSGKTLTVDGTLNSASITSTGGTINVNNGGVVNVTGASLPICTWNTGSTCVIVATGGSSSLTNGSQNFYNLTWSSSNQSSTLNIGTTTIINGKFLITTTNGNLLRLNNNTSAYSLTVGGDFEIQNGTLEFVGSSGTSEIKELLIAGNFIQSGGTITKNVSGTGTCNIVFNKSGTQTFTKSSGTISNAINFVVNSGSTLDLGTNIIDGSSGTFTLNSGAGIITANTAGITTTGATGSVQVTGTRTYNTGANYTYNAIAAQVTGNGLPATVNNLTINNSAGLTLTNNVAVTGALAFTSGSLSLNDKILSLNGSITGTSSLIGSAASSVSIGGTGALGTLNFDQTTDGTTNTLASLTLNRTSSGSATLGNKLVLVDALTPTAGTLNTGGYLHLRSRSTNTARIAAGATSGGYINGDVTVERYMSSANSGVSNRAYRLITPSVTTSNYIRDNWQEGTNNPDVSTNNNPVTHYGTHITGLAGNSAGFDVTQNNSNSLFNYNQTTNAWDAVTNTNATILDAKKGYLIFIRGSRNSLSTINTTTGYTDSLILRAKGSIAQGDQTFALTGVSGDFALVTNPYPAPINWASVYTTNSSNFNNYVTIWDPNQGSRGGYVTVTSGGVTTPGTSALTTNIQTGQAFFVQLNASAPTLNINEAHKSTTNNLNVYRTTTADAERLNINLKYTASGAERNADGVTALINNSYNNAVDGDDAEQIQNWDEDVALLRGNKELSIESRSNANTTDTLFLQTLRLRAAQANYKWEIEPLNIATITEASLIDNFTNTVTPLSLTNNTIINFTVSSNSASLAANRFKIVFKTNASLPVTVTKFTAQLKNNTVQLHWNTANEQNINNYEVERSVDGRTFSSIATVRASNSSAYNTIDNNPQYGINYYRLKTNEQNGKINYSNIIKIQVGKQVSMLVTVYPNPIVNNVLSVQLMNAAKGSYTLSLYNIAGQKVFEKTLEHQGGSSTENLAIGSLLSQGQYQLRIIGNNGYKNTETIIKQ